MDRLTTKDVAKALGLSERSIRLYAAQGRIPFDTTPGGHRRFELDAVCEALFADAVADAPAPGSAPTLDGLRARRRVILSHARAHGAHDVRVVGSVARGTADEDSDIDLLVTLDSDRGFADIEDLEVDLGALLGRKVDVLTDGACHGRFEHVADDAVRL